MEYNSILYNKNNVELLSIRDCILMKNNKDTLKSYFSFWRSYYIEKNKHSKKKNISNNKTIVSFKDHFDKYCIEYIMFAGMAFIIWLRYNERNYYMCN